jgi:hypothetical protein
MDAGSSEGGIRETRGCRKACFKVGYRDGPTGTSSKAPSASDDLLERGSRCALQPSRDKDEVVPSEIVSEVISHDADPSLKIRQWDRDVPVEAPRSPQASVDNLGKIGSADHDDAFPPLSAVKAFQ